MAYTGFWWGKPEGEVPLGRTSCRTEDNNEMDLQEVGCGGYGLDRSCSGEGELAGTFECGNKLSDSIKCGEYLD